VLRRSASLIALVLALASALVPGRATAQDDAAPITLTVTPGTGELDVSLGDLLDDGGLRRAIHQGLPLRVGVRAELWRDGFFDSQRGVAEWRASVVFDPVGRTYLVEVQNSAPRATGSLDEAARVLQEGFELPIRPGRPGRYYYLTVVEMETLSLTDLEELQRWLRGDLAPAVAGEDDVGSAVGRGVRRLFVRALGLPARRIRLRSNVFEIDGG
jgi:hypothetical protein